MTILLKALVLAMLFQTRFVNAGESRPLEPSKETKLPEPPIPDMSQAITLDEAVKQVSQNTQDKVLTAKTEVIDGKKIHVIKVLTASGYIQYIKMDAMTGKILDKDKK